MPRIVRHVGTVIWAMLLCFGLDGSSMAADTVAVKVERLDGGYSIRVPASVLIAQASTVSDFALYKLTSPSGKQLLSIYLGNFPGDKVSAPEGSTSTEGSIGGHTAMSHRWSAKPGTFSGITLIRLGTDGHWPMYARLVFEGLSGNDSKVAEDVVRSFEGNGETGH